MVSRILKKISRPLYKLFLRPSIRYSILLRALNSLLKCTPQEEMLELAMGFVSASKLDGDYLEFGVFEGKTFIMAFHFAERSKLQSMRFYAFDSFQGLPEIKGDDLEFKQFSEGEYACSLDRFERTISKGGVELNKVKIIPGWYNEVLNEKAKKELPINYAAIIWVDCDLYESTIPVLDFITDYLTSGTILIFDDWFCFRGNPNKGEQKATREWLRKHPEIEMVEYHKFGWRGNSFIIHKK
jgi:hypothetical protein